MMDMEFEKVADNIGNTEVNKTDARDNVVEIERGINDVK